MDLRLSEVEDCWGHGMTKTLSLTKLQLGSCEPSSDLSPHPCWVCLSNLESYLITLACLQQESC